MTGWWENKIVNCYFKGTKVVLIIDNDYVFCFFSIGG